MEPVNMTALDFVAKFLGSISTLIGIGVAIWGFWRWRAELFARRRIELCEDVLTRLYEVRDAIDGIRNPAVFGNEGCSRPNIEGESASERKKAQEAYVYIERFEKRKEAFLALNSLRYRFMAVYGSEWTQPFQVFVGIVHRIMMAAGGSNRLHQEEERYRSTSKENLNRSFTREERYSSILYKEYSDPDPIDQEISIAMDQLETKCREEIEGAASLWYGIRKFISKNTP